MRVDTLPFKANYFWSYKKDADLPPSMVAEKVLIYGDFGDINALQQEIGEEMMVKVWNEKIRKKPSYERVNTALEFVYGSSKFNLKYASANLKSSHGDSGI